MTLRWNKPGWHRFWHGLWDRLIMRGLVMQAQATVQDLRRHWRWAVLSVVLFAMAQHWLAFNVSNSLAVNMVWIEYGATPKTGDMMVFDSNNPLLKHPWVHALFGRERLLKHVAGQAGDTVTVVQRNVYVNGVLLGHAKEKTLHGEPLATIAPGVVPAGFLVAKGETVDSFDSRYAEMGFVPVNKVVGVAHPIW